MQRDLPDNPAKFSDAVLRVVEPMVQAERLRLGHEPRILDPFAGVGKVHVLGTKTVGVEIEPEWAHQHPRTRVGDSRELAKMFRRAKRFDMLITSCTYGTRMADHHDAQERCKACGGTGEVTITKRQYEMAQRHDKSVGVEMLSVSKLRYWGHCAKCDGKGKRKYKRNTYKHYLGRDLTEGNSGAMQWGEEYREFHRNIWAQVPLVLTESGLFVLNISNHIRQHEEMRVAQWHRKTILAQGGWQVEATRKVRTPRNGQGQNRDARVPFEMVYAFRRVA